MQSKGGPVPVTAPSVPLTGPLVPLPGPRFTLRGPSHLSKTLSVELSVTVPLILSALGSAGRL